MFDQGRDVARHAQPAVLDNQPPEDARYRSGPFRAGVDIRLGPTQTEAFWTEFLRSLIRRGFFGVRLVVSDDHEGLIASVQKLFGATWQRCKVHCMRNALASVPKQQRQMVAAVAWYMSLTVHRT